MSIVCLFPSDIGRCNYFPKVDELFKVFNLYVEPVV